MDDAKVHTRTSKSHRHDIWQAEANDALEFFVKIDGLSDLETYRLEADAYSGRCYVKIVDGAVRFCIAQANINIFVDVV